MRSDATQLWIVLLRSFTQGFRRRSRWVLRGKNAAAHNWSKSRNIFFLQKYNEVLA
jgi:hypothetical protein